MILASDQGAVVTRGRRRRPGAPGTTSRPAQFYHVATDDRFPYWIYGAQQDSGAAGDSVAHRLRDHHAARLAPDRRRRRERLHRARPGRPEHRLRRQRRALRLEHARRSRTSTRLWRTRDDYRGEWTLPLRSRRATRTSLYFANQHVFRTADGGQHWSTDQPGPHARDAGRAGEPRPAPRPPTAPRRAAARRRLRDRRHRRSPTDVLWCGTDDGLVWLHARRREALGRRHARRPDGRGRRSGSSRRRTSTPTPRTPPSTATASTTSRRTSIARGTAGRPGRWSRAASRTGSFVNAVREDPVRRGLLYAGTETRRLRLVRRRRPLAVAAAESSRTARCATSTCARDDLVDRHARPGVLGPGRPLAAAAARRERAATWPWLFAPRDRRAAASGRLPGHARAEGRAVGENPPRGAILDYLLQAARARPRRDRDPRAERRSIRRFASDDKVESPDLQRIQVTEDWVPEPAPPPSSPGMHRFVWDLHEAPRPELARGRRGARTGVWAPAGRYTVRLTAGGADADAAARGRQGSAGSGRRTTASSGSSSSPAGSRPSACGSRLRRAGPRLREQAPPRRQGCGGCGSGSRRAEKALALAAGPAINPEEFYTSHDAAPGSTSCCRLVVTLARLQRRGRKRRRRPDAGRNGRVCRTAARPSRRAWRRGRRFSRRSCRRRTGLSNRRLCRRSGSGDDRDRRSAPRPRSRSCRSRTSGAARLLPRAHARDERGICARRRRGRRAGPAVVERPQLSPASSARGRGLVGRRREVLRMAHGGGRRPVAAAERSGVGARGERRAHPAPNAVGRRDSGGRDPRKDRSRVPGRRDAGARIRTVSATWARSSTSGASTGGGRDGGRAGEVRGGTRSAGPRRPRRAAFRRHFGTPTTGSAR